MLKYILYIESDLIYSFKKAKKYLSFLIFHKSILIPYYPLSTTSLGFYKYHGPPKNSKAACAGSMIG